MVSVGETAFGCGDEVDAVAVALEADEIQRVDSEEALGDVAAAHVNDFVEEHGLQRDGVAEIEVVVRSLQRDDRAVDVLGDDLRLEGHGGRGGIEPVVADVHCAELDELVAVICERHQELVMLKRQRR